MTEGRPVLIYMVTTGRTVGKKRRKNMAWDCKVCNTTGNIVFYICDRIKILFILNRTLLLFLMTWVYVFD